MLAKRCFPYCLAFVIICTVPLIFLFGENRNIYFASLKVPDLSCKIANLSSEDPEFTRLVSPVNIVCSTPQPNLTEFTAEQNLLLLFDKNDTNCKYRCILDGPDFDPTKFDTWTDLTANSTRIDCEFINVQCRQNDHLIYTNFYSQIVVNKTRIKKLKKGKPTHHHNIILLVIDSVSRVNFERMCPKSIATLKSRFNWTVFEGFNKVGVNSFPNGLALLTGKRLENYSPSVWQKPMEDWADRESIVWNQAHNHGYLSLSAEDLTWANMFVYDAGGFRHKPTDHRQRPFWRACEDEVSLCGTGSNCLGDRIKHSVILDYMKQFLWKYDKQIPKLIMGWINRLVHEGDLGALSSMDNDLASFLDQNYDHLKESYLFIMGDHGSRGANLPDTNFARLQDMMPLFSFSVPQSVAKSNPTVLTNMQHNSKILASFYDAYVTLRDILHSSEHGWDNLNVQRDWSFVGAQSDGAQSLLRPLPMSRRCDQIGIPLVLCSCSNNVLPFPRQNNLSRTLSHGLISHINSLLEHYPQCARLELADTLKIEILDYSLGRDPASSVYYRLHVRAKPSNGTFEAVMVKKGEDYVVDGLVLRTNRFGSQSQCLNKAVHREYCFCRDFIQ